jgi:hypothetical protein
VPTNVCHDDAQAPALRGALVTDSTREEAAEHQTPVPAMLVLDHSFIAYLQLTTRVLVLWADLT